MPFLKLCLGLLKDKLNFVLNIYIFFYFSFSFRLLSLLGGHSVFSSPPLRPMTSDIEGFSIPDLFSYLNSWKRASIFPFECSVLIKRITGTIFITSLVWRVPCLGIEPGTSRTRSQHSTTRLSRRRWTYIYTEFSLVHAPIKQFSIFWNLISPVLIHIHFHPCSHYQILHPYIH
mgnify:CR=1 FL=1